MTSTQEKRSRDSKTELLNLSIANHIKATGYNIKWDHFEILECGGTDCHCKIKETLFTQELNSTLNTNLTSDKLSLY